LRLYDLKQDEIIATVKTDANGRFQFAPLKKGMYRLDTGDGFTVLWDRVDVTDSDSTKCKDPVYVWAGFSYPDCAWGYITKKWEKALFPEGPPKP
jgi:hypothetical protein